MTCFEGIIDRAGEGDTEEGHFVDTIIIALEVFPRLLPDAFVQYAEERAAHIV